MVSEKLFSEAAEGYLDTLYRVALNCLENVSTSESIPHRAKFFKIPQNAQKIQLFLAIYNNVAAYFDNY